jgi:hypothetical protein
MQRATLAAALVVALAVAGAASATYGYGTEPPPAPTPPASPPAAAPAAATPYRAPLSAAQEVPRPQGAARAAGLFRATVAGSGASARLRWRLTFGRLSGKAVAAHVHRGARGTAGPVLVPLCGPCRSGQSGSARLTAAAAAALASGRAYVNVHTARNPAGEIRGQLPRRKAG